MCIISPGIQSRSLLPSFNKLMTFQGNLFPKVTIAQEGNIPRKDKCFNVLTVFLAKLNESHVSRVI